jgi:hypothetical protein
MTQVHRFEDLKQRYAEALPTKAQEIAALWNAFRATPDDAAARAALHQGVHRLSGSAPAYGFEDVGLAAQRADACLSDWIALPVFARPALDELVHALGGNMDALLEALRRARTAR